MNNNKLNTLKRRALVTAISCVYMSLAIAPAYASDTEIYVDSSNASAVAPNLMMLFDTSGSMQWCVDDAANSTCSDVDKRRINVLKKAMTQILRGDTAAGIAPVPGYIKMGLSRYHTTTESGGYVIYPVRPLDAFMEISPTGTITSESANNAADAIQKSDQTSSGTITSGALKVGLDGTNDYVMGLQFNNVRIPKGATITSAHLELTASAAGVGPATWEIAPEATGNASSYGSSQINTRTYGGIANYSPDDWLVGELKTISVTGVINEVVNRSDWCGGNALALRIRDISAAKSLRTAYSYDTASNAAQRPRLVMSFSVNPEATDSCIKNVSKTSVLAVSNGNDDAAWNSDGSGSVGSTSGSLGINAVTLYTSGSLKNTVKYKGEAGILFKGVQIPQGATINSAMLMVTPNNDYSSVQPVKIQGFSSPTVDICPSGTCVSAANAAALPLTTQNIVWNPGSLSKNSAESIEVKDIVSALVNSSSWDLDKTLGFKLWNNGTTSKNTAIYSFNGSTTRSPRLVIDWTINELKQLTILETVRDQIEAEVNNLGTPSGTPLGAAFAEASRYMYGLQPYNKSVDDYDPRVVTNGGASNVQYISPIDEADNCSANYVFLLTDGEPLNDAKVAQNISTGMGKTCSGSSNVLRNWNCMKELAAYNNSVSKTNGTPKKRIFTSTMILGPLDSAESYMAEVAAVGGGKAYKATDAGALAAAFSDLVNEAMKASGTISAAGVAVNQLNRLNHLDQLFYAVFDPRPNSLHWEGNLKRYRLGANGTTIFDSSTPEQPAVDAETGFFSKNAKSFWSTSIDGDIAAEGGAASKLPAPNSRKMYTYMGSLSGITSPVNLTKIDLGDDVTFNPTAQTVTGTSGTEYTNLINWYKGYDIANLNGGLDNTTMQRKRLGGALHSRPILINYGYTGDIKNAAKPENQTNYVFFSTLEGTLHALNANTGEEVFSFIPGTKLARLKELFLNPASALPEFGMDLTWVSYRKDGDSTGQISGAKDKIWLYGGMRMGGDDYFALDVTNINAPKLMFAIDGGAVGTKYERMGQTWSEPVITSIYVEGKPQKVMIFGGGYDTKHENHNLTLPFATVDKGNQVYIVDAEKGTLLWMTSGNTADSADKYMPDMKFSIPSSPKAIDLDGDGITDVIYVGDLGGQVFRIDLDKKATTKADIAKRVVLLAKVGQTETATLANQRRFYEPPAVAMFKDTAGQRFATVVMGSGYRSRPLNTITKERFFTFFDKDVARTNLLTMEDTDLQAVITTSTLAPLDLTSAIVQQNGVDVTNKRGWYIDYPESGEKSLASGFIYSERLVFSTYSPVQSVTSNCSPVKGQTNMYVFCMPYGKLCPTTTAANGFDGYKKSNTMAGLGGEPQLMLVEKDDGTLGLTVLLGTTPDASVFHDISAGGAQLVPIKKWREKTQKN